MFDPLELGQIARLEGADNRGNVNASGAAHGGKAAESIAADQCSRSQIGLGPIADCPRREATDEVQFQVHRTPLLVERDSGHERHLVLRAPARLAARALPTEVGVVELDGAAEAMGTVLLGHGPVDLLVHQPGRGVAHAELTLECQGRQPGLGLADQVDGEKPDRQWQLGVLHEAACGQRRLVAAAVALEQLARAVADDVVVKVIAARTPEAVRPTRLLDCLGALRLSAEAVQELGNRHAVLELNLVQGHGARSVVRQAQAMASPAHGMSLAEAGF